MNKATIFFGVLLLAGQLLADSGGQPDQQQMMQQMMEMLKNSGMDPASQKQVEGIIGGIAQKSADVEAAKLKNEKEKFAAETTGHGTAQVEINGDQYELTLLKCEITDRASRRYSMHARQAPGNDNAELWVTGGGGQYPDTIQFSRGTVYEESGNIEFTLNDKTLAWGGMVTGKTGKVPLKFQLTCGAEIEDYAASTKNNPESDANVLTLQMGEETHTFQAGHCSTNEYRTGNLIVEFEATATGMFRGRPAVVLLSRSHPAESKQIFQNLDLLLGELSREQKALSPLDVDKQLRGTVTAYETKENRAITDKYKERMAALEKKYGKDIPPEKMGEWNNELMKVMDEQGKEYDKLNEQVKTMRYPLARSIGAITVKGQEVHFGGSKLNPVGGVVKTPEFRNLSEKVELWLNCGE